MGVFLDVGPRPLYLCAHASKDDAESKSSLGEGVEESRRMLRSMG